MAVRGRGLEKPKKSQFSVDKKRAVVYNRFTKK